MSPQQRVAVTGVKSPVPVCTAVFLSPCPVGCHQRFADAAGHSHSDLLQCQGLVIEQGCAAASSSRDTPGVTGPEASRLQVWWQRVLMLSPETSISG